MTTSIDCPLNLNPAYQKSPIIKDFSAIGIASYDDDNGRFPFTVEYSVNENMHEATIHSHKAVPANYDFLLEEIYSTVYEDLRMHGYCHVHVKTYAL